MAQDRPSLFDTVLDPVSRLREKVALLAAPAPTQIAWLVEEGLDADELSLRFLDVVPGWLPSLRAAQLITPPAERELINLQLAAEELLGKQDPSCFTVAAITEGVEWEELRGLAALALAEIDRGHR